MQMLITVANKQERCSDFQRYALKLSERRFALSSFTFRIASDLSDKNYRPLYQICRITFTTNNYLNQYRITNVIIAPFVLILAYLLWHTLDKVRWIGSMSSNLTPVYTYLFIQHRRLDLWCIYRYFEGYLQWCRKLYSSKNSIYFTSFCWLLLRLLG